jgi:hypothetical protein
MRELSQLNIYFGKEGKLLLPEQCSITASCYLPQSPYGRRIWLSHPRDWESTFIMSSSIQRRSRAAFSPGRPQMLMLTMSGCSRDL